MSFLSNSEVSVLFLSITLIVNLGIESILNVMQQVYTIWKPTVKKNDIEKRETYNNALSENE